MSTSWYRRFFGSTRGRLVTLLRRNSRTVDELAHELELTDNAVRAHLATLERDGFVRQHGVRHTGGAGKPAYAYELTPQAEYLFPRPYAAVLGELLNVFSSERPAEEVEAMLRDVGRRIAGQHSTADGDLRTRLEAATAALNELGGLAELEERDGVFTIRGYSCPLAALAPDHPEVCRLAEAFVAGVAGVDVRERCDRGPIARCRFESIA
jgi:predicted ArsR family transcriptional regulator